MEKKHYFFGGTQRVIQSREDSAIFHARVANNTPGFGSSCPFKNANCIINLYIKQWLILTPPFPQGARVLIFPFSCYF